MCGLVERGELAQVVPLEDVPVAGLDRLAQQDRAIELRADEFRAFGRDREEPDQPVVGCDPGVAAQDRLAEHRGPLDLEQERQAVADVPDAGDVLEVGV